MGIFILAASVAAIGFYVASVIKKRVSLLGTCVSFIKAVSVDIGYCGETVFVIMKNAAQNTEFKELSFLSNLSECDCYDFSEAWSAQMDEFKSHSALNNGDITLLKSFGNKLGTTDCFYQTQLCEEYIRRFEERYEYEKNKLSEKIRLAKVGGVACGVAVLILLL